MSYEVSNYIKDAHRTAPEQPIFIVFDEELHAVEGIVTEAGEVLQLFIEPHADPRPLFVLDLVKELGDVMWYVALWLHFHGFKLEDVLNEKMIPEWDLISAVIDREDEMVNISCASTLCIFAARLLDLLKKRSAYGKKFDVKTVAYPIVVTIVQIVRFIASEIRPSITMDKVLEINIDKLKKRFPNKFDADLAINRDENKESELLKSVI